MHTLLQTNIRNCSHSHAIANGFSVAFKPLNSDWRIPLHSCNCLVWCACATQFSYGIHHRKKFNVGKDSMPTIITIDGTRNPIDANSDSTTNSISDKWAFNELTALTIQWKFAKYLTCQMWSNILLKRPEFWWIWFSWNVKHPIELVTLNSDISWYVGSFVWLQRIYYLNCIWCCRSRNWIQHTYTFAHKMTDSNKTDKIWIHGFRCCLSSSAFFFSSSLHLFNSNGNQNQMPIKAIATHKKKVK